MSNGADVTTSQLSHRWLNSNTHILYWGLVLESRYIPIKINLWVHMQRKKKNKIYTNQNGTDS